MDVNERRGCGAPRLCCWRGDQWPQGGRPARLRGIRGHDLCGAVCSMFDMEGRYMEPALARILYKKVWAILDEVSEYSKTHYHEIPPEASLKTFLRSKLKGH